VSTNNPWASAVGQADTESPSPEQVLRRQAEYLWDCGATTSEMARLLNVPYGRAEQLRKKVSLRRERDAMRERRVRRIEQRTVAAACGVRSVVSPAAHISQAGRYSGSLEPPLTHHYDPRISGSRPV